MIRERLASLDGIRGLALVAVLAFHSGPGVFSGGFLGVEIFFVLSGYLLTSLLLDEHRRDGRIDHARYARRRVRRLVPAGLVLLTFVLLLAPLVAPDDAHRLRGDLLYSLFGLTNWHLIADGTSYFATVGRPPFVRHLWSLAVEIQFCLVCSVLAAWLARRSRKVAASALGIAIGASAIAMAVLYRAPDASRAYYGTDVRFSALLTGALIAVVASDGLLERVAKLPNWVPGVAVAVIALQVVLVDDASRFLYPVGFLVAQAATAILIVMALVGGRTASALSAGPLRWLGVRSYGIYLWHWPIVLLVRPGIDVDWHPFSAAVFSIGLAVVLGAVSFRFVESPFLGGKRARPVERLKNLLGVAPQEQRAIAGAAAIALVAGLVGLGTHLPTLDPIEESLRAGEEVLMAQGPPPTAAPSAKVDSTSTPGVRPASLPRPGPVAAPRPGPALGTFKPGSISVTALGDSVMVGAAPALRSKLGSSGYIDAAKNRRFSEAATIAAELRKQGRLGRIVIVHLGNNGPVKDGEVEHLLREVQGVQKVLLVTVRVNRGWQNSVNDTLRAAHARHKTTIKMVDWFAYSEGHPDWFHSDGTHLRSSGADAYSQLLTGSIPPPPTPKPTPKPKPKPKPTPTPNPLPLPSLLPPPR